MEASRDWSASAPTREGALVKVWDLPLRLSHWAMACCVLIAWFTPNTYDALHRSAGYGVLALTLFRLVWGFVGTRYSRFQNPLRTFRVLPRYLWAIGRGRSRRYLGLNPAGRAMSITMLLLLAVSGISGWMQVTLRFFGVAGHAHLYVLCGDPARACPCRGRGVDVYPAEGKSGARHGHRMEMDWRHAPGHAGLKMSRKE